MYICITEYASSFPYLHTPPYEIFHILCVVIGHSVEDADIRRAFG